MLKIKDCYKHLGMLGTTILGILALTEIPLNNLKANEKSINLESKIQIEESNLIQLNNQEKKLIIEDPDTSSQGYKFYNLAKKYLEVPYAWGGRSKKKLDCMGLPFLAYSDLTGESWKKLSVYPKELVKSKKLGESVKGLDGVLKENKIKELVGGLDDVLKETLDYNKLKIGDIVYFIVSYKASNEDFFTKIDYQNYWVWHMGIYAGKDEEGDPTILHASPGREVVIEKMEDIPFEGIYVTRFKDKE